jgi:hypothetical protein
MNNITTSEKTIVVSNIPLTKCINGFSGWQPTNGKQEEFLAEYARLRHLLSDFSDEELLSSISLSADEANAFLAQHGFDIKLRDHSDWLLDAPPDSIVLYIAAILKLCFKWNGTEAVIKNEYEGTRLDSALFFVSPKHTEPIVRIKSGEDNIYMTKAQPSFLAGLDDVSRNLNACHAFDYVTFPSIEYNEIIDVSWMVGMNAPSSAVIVLEAVQQDKFSMNYKGVKIESAAAVAIGMSGCSLCFGCNATEKHSSKPTLHKTHG